MSATARDHDIENQVCERQDKSMDKVQTDRENLAGDSDSRL